MQVQLRKESQRRQYGLAETLVALGWPRGQVIVIDDDQGHSGAEKHSRPGFQRLVSEVALGHVGIVLGIETSRLARNSEDWQHLLNLCGVMDTLIGDSEGIYDLRIHNDRMLLGLKGTLSEYELHLLQQRMIDGAAYKARRGELYRTLPAGYVLSEDGRPEFHPDEQVRASISEIFRSFRETGNALETYQELRAAGVRYPSRVDPMSRRPVQWSPIVYHHVNRVLTSPFYAGAYTFGRRHKTVLIEPNGGMRKVWRYRPLEQCPVVIWDHHPGYLTREEFDRIQERLRQNRRTLNTRGPANNGASLLAGLVKCAVCGHTLSVNYGGTRNRFPYYTCRDTLNEGPRKACLRFGGRPLEERVEAILLSVLEPEGLEAVLLALEDLEERQERQKRLWKMEVERAAQLEERCHRKFEEVEPGNRLVSRRLEERWEEALKILDESRRTLERRIARAPPTVDGGGEGRVATCRCPSRKALVRTDDREPRSQGDRPAPDPSRGGESDPGLAPPDREGPLGQRARHRRDGQTLGPRSPEERDPGFHAANHRAHGASLHGPGDRDLLGDPPASLRKSSHDGRRGGSSRSVRITDGRNERAKRATWFPRTRPARCSVSPSRRSGTWIVRGKLRSRQAYPNTRRRIPRADVERLLAERKRLGMKGGHQGGHSRGL